MHVGLNLVYLVPGATGGTETYARELIPELLRAAPGHRFTAFVNQEAASRPGPWNELIDAITVPVCAANRVQWVRGEQLLLPPLARRAGVQMLHSLANTAPGWGSFGKVVTIHDLHYRLVPEAHPGLRALGMRVLVPVAARRADRVITDAASTAVDLHTMLGVAHEKIDVVPLGVRPPPAAAPPDVEQTRRMLGAGQRPILLSVSAKLAHKNLIRLVGALGRLAPDRRPLLVLPGYPTPYEEQLRARVFELGLGQDVRLLGWVSTAELEGLYAAAAGFVFPSLAEGFGLPVLEAMARGLPVACSERGALAEVAGAAALRFDPESEPSIAAAIEALLADRPGAERLRSAGLRQVERYPWTVTAAGTLRSYERALGGPS